LSGADRGWGNAFADHVVVITGAGGGIGGATAALFARMGAKVVAADLNPSALRSLESRLKECRGSYQLQEVAVEDEASIAALFDKVRESYGRLDHLVNAAGITGRSDSMVLSRSDWDHILAVNLTGTLLASQAAARLMAAGAGGTIVNIASELAISTEPEKAAYIASKAGVVGLTKSLGLEWAPRGIRVNAVAPGATRTQMIAKIENDPVVREQYLSRVPTRRFGEPEEIAHAIAFLSSEWATHIVGHLLVVDGGYTVG
jgi:NAD(P)-dependent dehydrogenase (short-subunit alcohol dehydrogenase family)